MEFARLKERLARMDAVLDGAMELLEHEPMSRHTSFRIGGRVALMIVVRRDPLRLAPLLAACADAGIAPFFMGNGSNLLVSDAGYDGIVIQTTAAALGRDGNRLTAESGTLLSRLAVLASEHALTGLEFAHGIPGSVGGGLRMNAGAYGGELCQVVGSVTCLNEAGETVQFDNAACAFGYRTSIFTRRVAYIASADFLLRPGNGDEIRAKMAELQTRRREKQPLELPSAGSTFKRPEGHYASALIEACGLKGYTVGGAQVSEKHAGFVVNRGGATCRDVKTLMAEVRRVVLEKTGVCLEPEVQYLGGDD